MSNFYKDMNIPPIPTLRRYYRSQCRICGDYYAFSTTLDTKRTTVCYNCKDLLADSVNKRNIRILHNRVFHLTNFMIFRLFNL
jgi:hypothetical protein